MTEAQIYWLITLPKLANGIGIGLIMTGTIAMIVTLLIFAMSQDGYSTIKPIEWKNAKKYFNLGALALIIGALMKTFIPSTKELVAIYAIPRVVNNEQVQAIPEKLLELANLKLDDLIQETK